jgi:hypothetical protein
MERASEMRRATLGAWRFRLIGAALVARALAGCNYDFDEFENLGRPVGEDGGSGRGGAAGAARSDAAADTGRASDASSADGSTADRDDPRSDAADAGRGGTGGSAGATGSGGNGAGGTTGTGGSGGTGGPGGAGSGGSTVDAGTGGSADGSATGGAGGSAGATGGVGGASTGGAGAGGAAAGGTSGSGGSGGAAGAGPGGAAGKGGTGSGGNGGGAADAGAPDVRADSSIDGGSPFDCAAVSGRVYQGHCYFARTTAVAWNAGACPTPAHLVTITSAGEHDFVSNILSGESRWIGLRRAANAPKNPTAYEWVTGEANTFSAWYSANGEPDFDGACVRIGSPNLWGDHPCNAAFPVICERD